MKLTKDYNSRDGSTEFSNRRLPSINNATSRGSDQKYIAEVATECIIRLEIDTAKNQAVARCEHHVVVERTLAIHPSFFR